MATSKLDAAPYLVIFWSGGSQVGQWRTINAAFATRELAQVEVAAIVRAGRPAYIKPKAELEVIGWPEGPPPAWDFGTLAWRTGSR